MKKSKLYKKLNQETEEIGFFKKIKSIKTENNNHKKYARREMEGYFVENRSVLWVVHPGRFYILLVYLIWSIVMFYVNMKSG